MNKTDAKYQGFALCKEMLETPDVVRNFNPDRSELLKDFGQPTHLFLTGEGSSRIFPAKNAILNTLAETWSCLPFTEGATQGLDINLSNSLVLGASNSGRTKEVVRLFDKLKGEGHKALVGLTAHDGTPLGERSDACHVLSCGNEDAVAATKSVVEQAFFVDSLVRHFNNRVAPSMDGVPEGLEAALTLSIDADIVEKAAKAPTLYFAGRNNGVAEELTLKTNEITRKKSDFLEGTYGVHGIEEVMEAGDVLVLVDPFPDEEEKFETCLAEGIGMTVVSISSRPTRFPTLTVPDLGIWTPMAELCLGWNLLVEIGLHLGIDLDKPERARKVGNEVTS